MTQSDEAPVLLTQAGAVATLTLNRPDKLNAITDDLTAALAELLGRLDADETVRVVVLRGAGPAFMAGADLAAFHARPEQAAGMAERFQDAVRLLAALRKPVLASLHGAVAGGGLGLALACDLAIAAEDVRLVFAYTRLGVTCDAGLSYGLPRLVGTRKALEIALLSEPIAASEALRLGLVNWVVPAQALAAETARLADRLAGSDSFTSAATKALFAAGWQRDLKGQLDAELASFAACAERPEFRTRVAAFLAKAAPTPPNRAAPSVAP